jgi:hypothetical protein
MVKEVDAQEKRARQEGKASGGGISSIAGGRGKEVFPTAPWVAGEYVIVEPLHLIPDLKRRTILRPASPFVYGRVVEALAYDEIIIGDPE